MLQQHLKFLSEVHPCCFLAQLDINTVKLIIDSCYIFAPNFGDEIKVFHLHLLAKMHKIIHIPNFIG
ncbi:hypothetical protein AO718_17670 [Aeromonas veronii]|nr:hypothetical protein AO728_11420 [Aeromonas veronii]KRV77928.1 hypothetical protein AO719_14785 [Aeromonas veronii]KRV85072.1 hypothetical protein AO718_17670 [Aeromonas veronii]KRV88790.1 hypothetical protein AO721_15645 [Aeromonas veronii]KRV89570.1 hypothetical protein AO739_15760 [Aeromonas veronii]